MQTRSANPQDAASDGLPGSDFALVRYVGRHGVVTLDHVRAGLKAAGLKSGRSVTYARVARCIELGLVERRGVLYSEPPLLRATQEGIRFAKLGLPVASFAPGRIDHYLRCAEVANKAASRHGAENVFTEPEIPLIEAVNGELFGSAIVGESAENGDPRLHRADLVVVGPKGRIAVEVELSAKAPKRLAHLIRAWRRAIATNVVAEVHYVCRVGKTYRAVERAITEARAQDWIKVLKGFSR